MTRTPSSPGKGALTPLEAALSALLEGVSPVTPRFVPVEQARGRVAAAMPPVSPLPASDFAARDGWACRALDLLGATPHSPLALMTAPVWVDAGNPMPTGADCLLDCDLVGFSGPFAMAVREATPGQGVRRAGEDLARGRPPVPEGKTVCAADLLVARKAGLDGLLVRSPRIRIINVAAADHETLSARFILESVEGADATLERSGRDVMSIAAALDGETCDLIVLVGGTGEGSADATAEALASRRALIAHGLALQPGTTTAIGRLGGTPVIALPGMPDQAFAGLLALVLPVLERLAGLPRRQAISQPLSRKIASSVGICEIALLRHERGYWTPIAVGELPLDAIRLADAWVVVAADSEGHAAGASVEAAMIRCAN